MILGVLSTIGFSLVSSVRRFIDNIWKWFYAKILFIVEIDGQSELYRALDLWLMEEYPNKFRDNIAKFRVEYRDGIPDYQVEIGPRYMMGFVLFNHSRIFISKQTEARWGELEKEYDHIYTIKALKSKVVSDFLSFLEKYWNEKHKEGGQSITLKGQFGKDRVYRKNYKTFNDLFFKDKEKLIRHLDTYQKSELLYWNHRLKYKTGILLAGSAGNGKTQTALAIADYMKRNIYYVSPNSFTTDDDFQNYMMDISPKSVILMEDVDVFFGDREQGNSRKISVSLSSILNTFDGIFSPEDTVLVMTTNYPNLLDRALVRKGRLDLVIYLNNPDGKHINLYVQNYYGTEIDVVDSGIQSKIPMVDIEYLCKQHENISELKEALRQKI